MNPAALVPPQLVPLHLGALHPVEQVAVYVLAFGPFAVLAVVVAARRRAERSERPERPERSERVAESRPDRPGDQRDR